MADRDQDMATKVRQPDERPIAKQPPGGDAQHRHTDQDQLAPQGSDPADKRPTDPEAVERSDLPERDKQYGSDDN